MSRKTWSAVDDYIAESLLPADPVLDAALKANSEPRPAGDRRVAGARQAAQPAGPHERRKTILEIGTLGGYSTIWLARALPPGGKVVTLELEPHHADVARANLEEGRAVRAGRPARRAGAEIAGGAERRGRGAVRLHLHRRRQAEQPALSVLGDAAVAAGHGHRLRQRHPRRRGARTRTAATPMSKARGRRSRSSATRSGSTARRSRRSAPRAMTALHRDRRLRRRS